MANSDRHSVAHLNPKEDDWPSGLALSKIEFLDHIGDPQSLNNSPIALFCSSNCSGSAILRSLKWVGELATGDRPVIGGFHSAVEKSFLEVLLTGDCPLIVCPPRSLARYRIPAEYLSAIDSGRLSIVSSQSESVRTNSAKSSLSRNRMVAELATEVVVAHAAEGSKTEQFALDLVAQGETVSCLDPECKTLLTAGAKLISL